MNKVITADDGTVCETEAEAKAIDNAMAANEYGEKLAEAGWSDIALARQVNTAKAFLAYQVTGNLPELKVPKAKKEKAAE